MTTTKVLVCVGPGGVGKTTVAAGLAVQAAREGKKTLVLTIDPSRRLASTLGLEGVTDAARVPGADYPGELWAGVVDHRRTFDEFIRRAAGKGAAVEKLLNNRLYRQLSSTLAGSQDFTALEKLYTSVRDGGFDLVVLDTPPAQHALDFLEAPGKIANLFNEGIARWFRDPGGEKTGLFQKVINTGTRQVLKILEGLTGSDFLRELGDFFRQIEGWQDKLRERTTAVHRLLVSPDTEFCLVTSVDAAKLAEAERFARDIRKGGYHLGTLVLNRTLPEWWRPDLEEPPAAARPLFARFAESLNLRLRRVDDFASRLKGEVRVVKLPEWDERVYDLKGLETVAAALKREMA